MANSLGEYKGALVLFNGLNYLTWEDITTINYSQVSLVLTSEFTIDPEYEKKLIRFKNNNFKKPGKGGGHKGRGGFKGGRGGRGGRGGGFRGGRGGSSGKKIKIY